MLYVLAVLAVVIRVFGFSKTIKFITDLLGSRSEADDHGRARLNKAMQEMFGKKAEGEKPWAASRQPNPTAHKATVDDKISTKPARKQPPTRKNRSIQPRFIQNAGRTSQEILAGRPDFGWRRVH